MDNLRITLLQTQLVWQNPAANRKHFTDLMQSLAGQTDLIVLPEMFTTGFSMNTAQLAEPVDGPTVEWMQAQAKKLQAVVTGSLIIKEAEHYYNRLYWATPGGELLHYDKRHLFGMAGEHKHYTPGKERLVIDYAGWRICPLICYDLRFPVWSRNNAEIDLLLYVANWPSTRAADWKSLLLARAIENQCYVAAVNRIGDDGNGLNYQGDSSLIDPGPKRLLWQKAGIEATPTLSVSKSNLQQLRHSFPFLADRDLFNLES